MQPYLTIGLDLDSTLTQWKVRPEIKAAQILGLKGDFTKFDFAYSNFDLEHRAVIYDLFKNKKFMGLDNVTYAYYPDRLIMEEWHNKGCRIVIITSRDHSLRKITEDIVDTLFPHLVDHVYITANIAAKKSVMKAEKLDVWIDDAPDGVELSHSLGIQTFLIHNLITYVYNAVVYKTHTHDEIIPVTSVYEASKRRWHKKKVG